MVTVTVDKNENLEKALKRFKRMIEKEAIIREWKRREYYEKPSTIRVEKGKRRLKRKQDKKSKKIKTKN